MILAIDAGNSRVKWGWHDGKDWTSIATVSLIEFAASSDHVNPFSVTHADPERIIEQIKYAAENVFDQGLRSEADGDCNHACTRQQGSNCYPDGRERHQPGNRDKCNKQEVLEDR